MTDEHLETLRTQFSESTVPDQLLIQDFDGLCEAAALDLGELLNVTTFVLERDGEVVGDSTDTFTNVVELVVESNTVVSAHHD